MMEKQRKTLEQMAGDSARGLRCPSCQAQNFAVFKTRPGDAETIRRQRVCRNCGHQFLTAERVMGRPRK